MVFVNEVFGAAMALMDELSVTGNAQTRDTQEYSNRTCAIMNILTAEYSALTGGGFLAVEELEDALIGIPDGYALSVLPYGLAANLLVDENPTAASFYQQRYEDMMKKFVSHMPARFEDITDVYGVSNEYGEFSRW